MFFFGGGGGSINVSYGSDGVLFGGRRLNESYFMSGGRRF